jgi:hypothetical protein
VTTLHDYDEVPFCEEPFQHHVDIQLSHSHGDIDLLVMDLLQYSKCASSSLDDGLAMLTLQLYAWNGDKTSTGHTYSSS